jgi:YYY domain-containing protein
VGNLISWWLVVEIVGLAAVPFTFLFFRSLADRGYAFSKPAGILLFTYVVWLGGSLHLFPARVPVLLGLLLVFAAASCYLALRHQEEFGAFLRSHLRYILLVEAFFALAFATAVFLRSYLPDITGGERPMEFAFFNASYRADFFPPKDPWLAGFHIAYYYFGYVMGATLSKLAAVPTSFSFYATFSLVGALSAVAAFGVAYNLVAHRSRPSERAFWWPAIATGVVAAVFLIFLSNLQGVFELLSRYGIGSHGFYQALNLFGLDGPTDCQAHPEWCRAWYPTRDSWWWFATRMSSASEIREFPFWSLQFGDLHPHVMAMPFILMAGAVALEHLLSDEPLDGRYVFNHPWRIAFTALAVGSLGFIQSWNLPAAFFLLGAAVLLSNVIRRGGWRWGAIGDTVAVVAPLAALSALFFLPYYLSSSPPLRGLKLVEVLHKPGYFPEDSTVTPPIHFLIFWLPLLLPVVALTAWYLSSRRPDWRRPSNLALSVLPWLIPIAIWGLILLALRGVGGFADEITARDEGWLTVALIALVFGGIGLAVSSMVREIIEGRGGRETLFALVLAGTAALLWLGMEFFFLVTKDDQRANTVFRLGHQAWVMLSVASAFAVFTLVASLAQERPQFTLGRAARMGSLALIGVVLAAGLVFPITATFSRTEGFTTRQRLDGLEFLKEAAPDEYWAVRWLNEQVSGTPVILEAPGLDYADLGRVSSRTGLPAVIGRHDHEQEWRNFLDPLLQRVSDVQTAYTTMNLAEASAILDKYGVDYVYVGSLERLLYPQEALDKFSCLGEPVFSSPTVTVYRVSEGGAIGSCPTATH